MRPLTNPDSAHSAIVVGNLDDLVSEIDRPLVAVHVSLVTNAPGAALLVWGPDAVCLAYNRSYRALAGLRTSAAGKPLFRAQPELERTWKPKLDQVLAGSARTVDGSAFVGGPEGIGGDHQMGWLLPVEGGPGGARGALCLFMDASALVEPSRRLLGAVAHDLREPLIGIRVVSERLGRLSKPTRERCVEDTNRILSHASVLDRIVDDMGAFARRSGAGGARLALRVGDLGAIVRSVCEKLDAEGPSRLHVSVTDVQGAWDEEAIGRILTALIASARQGCEAEVTVELTAIRECATLWVRDDGPGLRPDEAEQLFEPWKRVGQLASERRCRGVGLGLYLARELVNAHGGRIAGERPATGGFAVRVTLPINMPSYASGARSFKTAS